MTNGGEIVTFPGGREADIAQAEVFHTVLAERRAMLCDRLDAQTIELARYEQSYNTAGARRKRRRLKEIGAELRDVDRMMHALRVQLTTPPRQRSG